MAKAKLKDKQSSGDSVKEPNSVKLVKKQKKKFWHNPKPVTKKNDKNVSLLLPPKTPQDFSSNWKALQEVLKQKVTSAATSPTTSKHPRKEQKVTDKKNEDPDPQKSAHKINGNLKGLSSAPKEVKKAPKELSLQVENKQEERKKRKWKIPMEEADTSKVLDQKKKPTEEANPDPPKIDIWFDDVDPDDIEAAMGHEAAQVARKMQGLPEKTFNVEKVLVKEKAFEGLTRTVAMDCEMVGVGLDGEESILARVSIVNQFGKCVYDKYVKPTERVTDYRTAVSGIRPKDIKNGEHFKVVQKEVSEILKGRILVGHALHNDLKILFLDHPKKAIRDTQRYKPFKQHVKSGRPSLKLLCEKILNVKVQSGEHCSIQDAQAAMRLYTMEKKQWEAAIKAKYSSVKADPQKEDDKTPSQ
ncbi:RNA exonuclease 4 isoform 1-T2 [Rhinophrynus dorsalis]